MPEPAYAVVDILCDTNEFRDLAAIPNLLIEFSPEVTDDPAKMLVHAFADEDAQAAARAMGCTVAVLQSAEDYAAQVAAAYAAINDGDDGGVA
ncbi:hypothetical protein [Nocardia sp. NPDC052112]|uniref:hypothetical protein n=1 Tax=Nocardia sp. NPDC052112 TaxID=3155646 RepID=UPI00342F14CD